MKEKDDIIPKIPATSVADCRLLDLHRHERDGVELVSCRLVPQGLGFTSPEVYTLRVLDDRAFSLARGCHAHHLKEEVFTIMSGGCRITVHDGRVSRSFELDETARALYVPAGIWHEVTFRQKSVLQVIASTEYSDTERRIDYIEDFDLFCRLKGEPNAAGFTKPD